MPPKDKPSVLVIPSGIGQRVCVGLPGQIGHQSLGQMTDPDLTHLPGITYLDCLAQEIFRRWHLDTSEQAVSATLPHRPQ